MKLILCATNLPDRAFPEPVKDTYIYVSLEDYSVGPLLGWPDPLAFRASRAAFFQTILNRRLPDGTHLDYFEWVQVVPDFPSEHFMLLPEDSWPLYELEDVLPIAERIEIWVGSSVREILCKWRIAAELVRLGVSRDRVSLLSFPGRLRDKHHPWYSDRLLDELRSGCIPTLPIPEGDWERMTRCWDAVIACPVAADESLLQDPATRRVFEVLGTRRPDAATGLNMLQKRLIVSARSEWMKMARIIGEAMALGYGADDQVGDWVLQAELRKLAGMTPPPVEIEGDDIRNSRVRLTQGGAMLRQALAL